MLTMETAATMADFDEKKATAMVDVDDSGGHDDGWPRRQRQPH